MKEKKGYISKNGFVVGHQLQKIKGFKKIGGLDCPLDIHITATEEQLKNGRLTITVHRIINNELYETFIPNVKVDEFPIQFIDEEEDEALDFIAQQEDIAMQRARENAVESIRRIKELKATTRKNQNRR